MNFASTWNNLLKHCISAEFRLMEGHVQGTLRKELYIAPLVKCFKTATLGKSSQLAQPRCDNVVTTSLLTLSQRCGMVENESCTDVSLRRCDKVALQRCQDVAAKLLQRRHNIKHWIITRSFYYGLF